MLTLREGTILITVLKVESITILEMIELNAHDAGKCGPDNAVNEWQLWDATREQIDILNMFIVILETSTLRTRHVLIQLLKSGYFLQKHIIISSFEKASGHDGQLTSSKHSLT